MDERTGPGRARRRTPATATTRKLRRRLLPPGPRIALPLDRDPRVAELALWLADQGVARPVVIGSRWFVEQAAARLGTDPRLVPVLDPESVVGAGSPDVTAGHDHERPHVLPRALVAAATLAASGGADALIAGSEATTADVLSACSQIIGRADDTTVLSGFFLMSSVDGRGVVFADCAVRPDPTAEELARIAVETAQRARIILDEEPRVAMLSFSTHGSAHHRSVEKVRRATEISRRLDPALHIDGELQADAALDMTVAGHKGADGSDVAGRANVLVFPQLDAANIAYKLVRSLGHATAAGAIITGYRLPVCDLSRGATLHEITDSAVVLAALCGARLSTGSETGTRS